MSHSSAGAAFTSLILETFRLNGRLLSAGDRLTSPINLSSARWQVLRAIAETPFTVAQAARNMGLTRQSVQRIANELETDGFAEYVPNPNHERAKLVQLTSLGKKIMATLRKRQTLWANRISAGIRTGDIESAITVMRRLRERLEADSAPAPGRGHCEEATTSRR